MSVSSKPENNGAALRIIVEGRFDFSQLQPFKTAYESLDKKPERFIVDLKTSNYIDSSALGMLLALRDYAGGDESSISIVNAPADIRKILVITKLDELFKLE